MAKRGTKGELLLHSLAETCRRWEGVLVFQKWRVFSERVCNFSLRSPSIEPSDFFGPRRKVALRGKGFVWASIWGSFDKLREVGVFSYLLYLLFKCFVDG